MAALVILIVAYSILYYQNISTLFSKIAGIVRPFLYGFCIAYLLNPLCNKFQKLFNKINGKDNKTLAITATEVWFIITVLFLGLIILPQSIRSLSDIIANIPNSIDTAQNIIDKQVSKHEWLQYYFGKSLDNIKVSFNGYIKNTALPLIQENIAAIINSATLAGKFIVHLILGVIISIFILNSKENFKKNSKRIVNVLLGDKRTKIIIEELAIADKMFSGFFFGKTVDSLIVGVICFIILVIMKMPYVSLVSIIVCLTNIIPIVGPFIGAIPSAIIIFSADPVKAIQFLIFILVLQQIDGHLIGPKCIGSATGLSTFWVLFAIIFFGGLYGIAGMVIGVPLLAVIFDIIDKVIKSRETLKQQDKENNTKK